ncbi:acrosin-like [Catharus ustulatus]|uniref:acrosin-like n=1 Tax=Catharus ustulatus TaxID=91951 RepID=UPI001C5B09B7|nr:acrosin-like [Catharus ustulatus]
MAFDHSSLVDEDSQDSDFASWDSSDDSSQDTGDDGVHLGAWPGVISIQATLENGTWHMCSGALIHNQWVVTVASCFTRAGDISRWEVVIGASDLSQPGPEAEVRHIQTLVVHEQFDPATTTNNIALVELDQPVECSDYIQLGCVPDSAVPVGEMKTCYMAGWRVAPHSAPGPRLVLQEAKVRLMDVQLCNSSRWYRGAVHPQDLCAGYPRGGIDTCQGDIGGPLVCKDNDGDYFWLVGLTSWGRGCSGNKRPGVFTSAQFFHNWMQVHMGLVPPDADVPLEPVSMPDMETEEESEEESDLSASSEPRLGDISDQEDMEDYSNVSFQQVMLGKFLDLLLDLLDFLKGKNT